MRAQVVSFHCVLKDSVGEIISSTFNQDVITQVQGQGEMLRGLADGLKNLRKGEKRKIQLSADQAYGFYDPGLVVDCPRAQFEQGRALKVGDNVVQDTGDGKPKVFRVTHATRRSVTLDGNHPLAGLDLVFEIEATAARDATLDEICESTTPAGADGKVRYLH